MLPVSKVGLKVALTIIKYLWLVALDKNLKTFLGHHAKNQLKSALKFFLSIVMVLR